MLHTRGNDAKKIGKRSQPLAILSPYLPMAHDFFGVISPTAGLVHRLLFTVTNLNYAVKF